MIFDIALPNVGRSFFPIREKMSVVPAATSLLILKNLAIMLISLLSFRSQHPFGVRLLIAAFPFLTEQLPLRAHYGKQSVVCGQGEHLSTAHRDTEGQDFLRSLFCSHLA